MEDYHITPNFTYFELTKSDKHPELVQANRKNAELFTVQLKDLADLLELVRILLNEPLLVDCGFRDEALNKAVGGVFDSQHTLGEACDVRVKDIQAAFEAIRNSPIMVRVGQIILEDGWIHISTCGSRKENRCHMALRYSRDQAGAHYYIVA